MHRRRALFSLVTLAAAGCAGAGPDPIASPAATDTRDGARRRLEALAARYEALMAEHGRLEWSRYAGKTADGPEARRAMERLRKQERELFVEADRLLLRWGDDLVAPRQAALWRRGGLGLALLGDPKATELADELEAIINDHQFEHGGKRLTRGDLIAMRRSADPAARRETRRLEHQLHRRAAPVAKALLLRRRDLARELGVGSFYPALLELRGVPPKELDALFQRLDQQTRRPFARLMGELGKALGRRMVQPWDADFALRRLVSPPDERFAKERALPAAYALYRAFGIDLEKSKLDVTVRDFAFGGQTIGVRIPDDVRLVLNPLPGVRFQALTLHELGHAYAMTRTTATHPLYKAYEWVPGLTDPGFAEGIAEVFGRLLDEPRVLTEHLGLAPEEARRLIQARRLEDLLRIRRALASIAFERAALERPDADLDQISLLVERRYGGFFLGRDVEPVWATTPFLATYPVYIQSYTLAAVSAVQLREALKARFGERWISPEAGSWLTERMVEDGARWTFREKLIRATGRSLDPGPLLAFINGREP